VLEALLGERFEVLLLAESWFQVSCGALFLLVLIMFVFDLLMSVLEAFELGACQSPILLLESSKF